MSGSPTDLFDRPTWTAPAEPKHVTLSIRPSLAAVAIGAGAVAASMALPWYGAEPSFGRLSLGFGVSPLSHSLFPLSLGPGGTGWGFLFLGLALLTSLTALVVRAVVPRLESRVSRLLRGVRGIFFVVSANADELRQIADLADQGQLRPIVAQTFPLAEAAVAYGPPPTPRKPGKTVLVVRS